MLKFHLKNKIVSVIFRTPGNTKANSGLNPEADEFVPVFSVIL